MSCDTTLEAVAALGAERREVKRRAEPTVLALLTLVIVLDQVTKWWAWRHFSTVTINVGGDPFVGHTVGGLFAGQLTGARLDLLDAALLGGVALTLMRGPKMTVLRACATLVVAGWMSNLLDRLGMHQVTAPGSPRGAIDFIHIDGYYINVADFFIAGATIAFLAATGYLWIDKRLTTTRAQTLGTPGRPRARTRPLALASGIGILVVVAMGAAQHQGLTAPLASTGAPASRRVSMFRRSRTPGQSSASLAPR
jgi:lipoprotein signal peptidase